MTADSSEDEPEKQSGYWLGSVAGLSVREPGPDADGPILEVIGEEGMVPMEFDNDAFIEGLTHAASEIQMVLDQYSDGAATGEEGQL